MDVREKMWLTADRSRVVKDGDPEAKFLYATPGMNLQPHEADRFGIVDGTVPSSEAQAKAAQGEKVEGKAVDKDEVEDKAVEQSDVENKSVEASMARRPTRRRKSGSGLTITRLEDKE